MTTSNKTQAQIKKMNMRQLQKYAKSHGMDISDIKRKNELLELILFSQDQQSDDMAILSMAYSSTIEETPIVETIEETPIETPIVEKVETPIDNSIERNQAIEFLKMITDSPTEDMINSYLDSIQKAKEETRKETIVSSKKARKARQSNNALKGNRAKCARLLATIVSAPELFEIFNGDHVVMSSDVGMAHGFTADQCKKYMTDWSHSYGSLGAHFLSFGFRSRGVKRTSTIEFYLLTSEEQKDLCGKMKKDILIEATEESAKAQIEKMLSTYTAIEALDSAIAKDLSK